MILSFPTPYPDELLYSIFARYHIRSGNTLPKITTEELFGKKTIRSVLDLPANLEAFLKELDVPWNVENLIYQHTMFPYYAPFLMPQQALRVKASMLASKGGTVHSRIGINASNVRPKSKFWVCDECMLKDIEIFGETYWHRVHQAPAVYFCPLHKTTLQETNISIHAQHQHEYIPASLEVTRSGFNLNELSEDDIQNLIQISQMTEKLLTKNYSQSTSNFIRRKYSNELYQRGYASIKGFLKREPLYKSFQGRFSKVFLTTVQSPVAFEESDWLTMIFQKHRKSFHPVRHLLILSYLGIDVEDLFVKQDFRPFGKGPWPCLNLTCVNYRKPVITSIKITRCYDTGKPVGTFECNCGFIFSRRGPDLQSSDRYKIGTIKNYGDVWLKELSNLVQQKKKLIEIASELQADRETIKKYVAKLGLEASWKKPENYLFKEDSDKQTHETRFDELKCIWLKLQDKHPSKTKTELRAMVPAVYASLYRIDKEWLHLNSPIKKRSSPINKRVDWKKRDEDFLKQVKEIIKYWDKETNEVTKISFTTVGKKLGKLYTLSNNREKLPKTIAYIKKVEEDVISFQIRRAIFVIEKAAMEGEFLKEWEVYKIAGLRPTVSDDVKLAISRKLKENTEYGLNNAKSSE